MKIYLYTTKRIAKKKLKRYWRKYLLASKLKKGDLISTCKGYNERIKEIRPLWTNYGLSKGLYVSDFDIITESGSCCSLANCCSEKETKEQILLYWNNYKTKESQEFYYKMIQDGLRKPSKLIQGVIDGKDVFDEDGQPYFEFAEDYERKARFPELIKD